MTNLIGGLAVLGSCAFLVPGALKAATMEDCPVPANISSLSNSQLVAQKSKIDSKLESVDRDMNNVKRELEKVNRLTEYRERGYSKRASGGPCNGQARLLVSVRKKCKSELKPGQSPKDLAKCYEAERVAYQSCMDNAIRNDEDFKALLREDPGAAKFSKNTGRYSFATANLRYRELQMELMPKDHKGPMEEVIGPLREKLSKEYEDLDNCVGQLNDAKERIQQECAARAKGGAGC